MHYEYSCIEEALKDQFVYLLFSDVITCMCYVSYRDKSRMVAIWTGLYADDYYRLRFWNLGECLNAISVVVLLW
jgi:hypothetical protein